MRGVVETESIPEELLPLLLFDGGGGECAFVWSFLRGWRLDDFGEWGREWLREVAPDAESSLSAGHYYQGGPKAGSHFRVQRSL